MEQSANFAAIFDLRCNLIKGTLSMVGLVRETN